MKQIDKIEALAIDPHNLDEEWLTLPQLFNSASNELDSFMEARDFASDDYDKLSSEKFIDIKTNPEDFGLDGKPNDSIVKAMVDLDEHVIRAKKHLAYLKRRVKKAENLQRSIELKKKSLEGMVRLFISQYFSVPNEGKMLAEGKRFVEIAVESVAEDQRQKLNEKHEERKHSKGRFSDAVTKCEDKLSNASEEEQQQAINKMSKSGQEGLAEAERSSRRSRDRRLRTEQPAQEETTGRRRRR